MKLRQLLKFPVMVIGLFGGLIFYTLTEAETFLLAIVSVLFGLHFGVLWGLTVYFAIYLVMRMIGGYVSMIAKNLEFIARSRGRG